MIISPAGDKAGERQKLRMFYIQSNFYSSALHTKQICFLAFSLSFTFALQGHGTPVLRTINERSSLTSVHFIETLKFFIFNVNTGRGPFLAFSKLIIRTCHSSKVFLNIQNVWFSFARHYPLQNVRATNRTSKYKLESAAVWNALLFRARASFRNAMFWKI